MREEKESWETRNVFEQRQLASRVNKQMNELISLLTRSLNIHLNVGQHFQVNSSAVFLTVESLTGESLSNKQISTVDNALLRLPSTWNISLNDISNPSLRVRYLFSSLLSFVMFDLSSRRWNLCLPSVALRWICLDRFHCHWLMKKERKFPFEHLLIDPWKCLFLVILRSDCLRWLCKMSLRWRMIPSHMVLSSIFIRLIWLKHHHRRLLFI